MKQRDSVKTSKVQSKVLPAKTVATKKRGDQKLDVEKESADWKSPQWASGNSKENTEKQKKNKIREKDDGLNNEEISKKTNKKNQEEEYQGTNSQEKGQTENLNEQMDDFIGMNENGKRVEINERQQGIPKKYQNSNDSKEIFEKTNKRSAQDYYYDQNDEIKQQKQQYYRYNQARNEQLYDDYEKKQRNQHLLSLDNPLKKAENLRESELQWVEEEENNISVLRELRFRIEQLSDELEKREKYTRQLEKNAARADYLQEQYEQMKKRYTQSLFNGEDQSVEVQKLSSQVTTLQAKVHRQEQDLKERDQKVQQMSADQIAFLKQSKESEAQVIEWRRRAEGKENWFTGQLEEKNKQMQQLINENSQFVQVQTEAADLRYELSLLQEAHLQIVQERDSLHQTIAQIKENHINEQVYRKQQEQSIETSKYLQIITELQQQLERHIALVKTQEATIAELRRFKSNDEKSLATVSAEMDVFQKELTKIHHLRQDEQQELKLTKSLLDEKNNEVDALKGQLMELKQQLSQQITNGNRQENYLNQNTYEQKADSSNSNLHKRIKTDLEQISQDLKKARRATDNLKQEGDNQGQADALDILLQDKQPQDPFQANYFS